MEGDCLQEYRYSIFNMLNEHTDRKGWSQASGLDIGLTTHHRKNKHVKKYHEMPPMWILLYTA
jgi:hypothetical protein